MQTHEALQKYFERKKKSAPGFSIRSLARRLDVSPSFLSRVMTGKKPIPESLLPRLANALDVEPDLFAPNTPSSAPKKSEGLAAFEDWSVAQGDHLQVLRNWFYLPIMELTTLKNFGGTAEEIALRLKISQATADIALRELMAIGLITCEDGRYRKTSRKIKFASAKSTHLIRRFHHEMLEKAQEELRTATSDDAFQKRLITGLTVTASPEALQAAQKKLADCLVEIANDLTKNPGTEVYQLGVQLFPLSKPIKTEA